MGSGIYRGEIKITRNFLRREERKKRKKKRRVSPSIEPDNLLEVDNSFEADNLLEVDNSSEVDNSLEVDNLEAENQTEQETVDNEASNGGFQRENSSTHDDDSQSHQTEEKSCRKNNDFIHNEGGKIVFSKIEDIPTMSENPKFVNIFTSDSKIVGSNDCSNGNYTKLKFEMKPTAKRNQLTNKTASSTFAELSNKLGPTVNLNCRRGGLTNVKSLAVDARGKTSEDVGVGCVGIQSANTVAEDMELDENEDQEEKGEEDEDEDEVIYLKTSKSRSKSRSRSYSASRSRSRSYTYSRSRSRSYSYSSYSRSRSRSYSYSRSRSRSYSYSSYSSRSRSRSRSRSPSIVRRRGSPSFLDKRRITR